MSNLEKDILDILKSHKGNENKLTQYEIADKFLIRAGNDSRNIRRVIECLIEQGYPIISTPKNGGGYFWQEKEEEGLECYKRMRRMAIKLFLKARRIRANSRMGQLKIF